jgi:DNA helicase HerA-like ATPase
MAAEATAWSMGGRAFDFQSRLTTRLPMGSHVLLAADDGRRFLGQIVEKQLPSHDGTQPSAVTDQPVTRSVLGRGTLVAQLTDRGAVGISADDGFESATMATAPAHEVAAWMTAAVGGATTLTLGALPGGDGGDALLLAAGFNRHTFLCGQSGSGKTYTLGVILEQLLLRTELPMVVLDPNSDYVRLDELETVSGDVSPERAEELRRRTCVFRTGTGTRQLRVRFGRLPLRQQAMVLALDPLQDADQYDVLRGVTERMDSTEFSLADVRRELDRTVDDAHRALALRIDNLGVARWEIWAERDEPPILDQLPADWRAAVMDLGGLAHSEERSVIAASVLSALWEARNNRQPLLIVIDEAHNVCPQHPADHNQALAIEHTARIAAEGRKYGLYLLLATQSPQKLHLNVLSQCENLVLMKTNSAGDVAHLADVFSHVPRGLVSQATGFRLGEGLVAGRIAAAPMFFRSGRRQSPEGGADIPTTWTTIGAAQPRSAYWSPPDQRSNATQGSPPEDSHPA